jgi:hypothetical protein
MSPSDFIIAAREIVGRILRASRISSRASSTEWMVTMFGWLREATARASRRNRSSRSGLDSIPAGSTLSATSRPSFVSVARQTSPMPPAPRAAVIR